MSNFLEYETEEELIEEQDSGVWLSVGDLMSGLLMIFILLFVVIQIQLQEKINILSNKEEELNTKEKELQEIINKSNQLEKELIRYKNILDELPARILNALETKIQGKGYMEVDPKTGDVKLGEQILFDRGSVELKLEGKTFLNSFIPVYSESIFSDPFIEERIIRIIIEGHTSSEGTEELNMELSLKRALSVTKYISSLDFPTKNKFIEKILPAGRGEIEANKNTDLANDRKVLFRFQLKREDFDNILNKMNN